MIRAAYVFVAVLALSACSGNGGNDPLDAGPGDAGTLDGGTHCFVLDAGSCTTQAQCFHAAGESAGSTHIYACAASGNCERQGSNKAGSCYANVPTTQARITLASDFGSPGSIHSFQMRAFYPSRVDGSPVTCADVLGSTDYLDDGGSSLDADGTFNLEAMQAAAPNCSAGQGCLYLANVNLVAGTSPVVLVQAYTGTPDVTGTHSHGSRLGEGCATVAVTEMTSPAQQIPVTISPN